jgi:hypothetical protein
MILLLLIGYCIFRHIQSTNKFADDVRPAKGSWNDVVERKTFKMSEYRSSAGQGESPVIKVA